MLYEFIQSKQFSKAWDSLGLLDDDLRMLELEKELSGGKKNGKNV